MRAFIFAALAALATGFVAPRHGVTQAASALRMSEETGSHAPTAERIETMVSENKVMLFMKGTKIFPQCGFSNMAVQILNAVGVEFGT